MKQLPAKTRPSQLTTSDPQVERIDNPVTPFSFFNFTYTRHEMRIGTDGQTHVKQKKVQLENGRIESEAFEGYAPAEMFEQAMKESQRLFANQATWLLKQFSLFPMLPGTRSDDDSK